MWGTVIFNTDNQNAGRGTAAWQVQMENGAPQQKCVLPLDAAEVEWQIPFATWQARAGCPAGSYATGVACVACPAGTIKAVGGGDFLVPTACAACEAGTGPANGATTCEPCGKGTARLSS